MPIVVEVLHGEPLGQDDILKGLKAYSTSSDWLGECQPRLQGRHPLMMILSRRCVVGHKPRVVAAMVERFKQDVPRDADTYRKVKSFLSNIRDGRDAPDVFYLGQLPGLEGRYGARFDSLFTLELPDGNSLLSFLESNRIGRLSDEFIRDLHVRIFSAFAPLGFDDHKWYSNPDLKWLVQAGKSELQALQAKLEDRRAELAKGEAAGFSHQSVKHKLNKNIEGLKAARDTLVEEMRPYEEELKARGVDTSELGADYSISHE